MYWQIRQSLKKWSPFFLVLGLVLIISKVYFGFSPANHRKLGNTFGRAIHSIGFFSNSAKKQFTGTAKRQKSSYLRKSNRRHHKNKYVARHAKSRRAKRY